MLRTVTRLDIVRDWFRARSAPSSLLVVAPRSALREDGFLAAAPDHVPVRWIVRLGADLEPGDNGSVASSLLPDGSISSLEVAALPDKVSRYNSPSRAEAVRRCVLAAKKKGARRWIVVVLEHAEHAAAVANAVGRALPLLDMKSTGSKDKPSRTELLLVDLGGRPIAPTTVLIDLVETNRQAARLVDMPPTELDPASFASEARALLRGIPSLRVAEIKGADLLRKRLGGIHAVGRCARAEPRLLIASTAPRSSRAPHIALVGKGITYDTGGLHLKARGSMETMKSDMGGAAAMLGAFRVLARHHRDVRCSLLLCIAENAIGPNAYKPDDILTMHSGKTVEINNTDAEGRLVLADGVSYAARVLGADIVLDAATLTGAQLVATGTNHAAVMSNDDALERLFVDSGRRCGDLVHPLPFAPEFYRQEFSSPLADLRNSVKDRSNAQTSCAGQFIFEHLAGTDVRWGHVDLAGPAYRDQRGTGFGVALFVEVVCALTAQAAPAKRARRIGKTRA